MGRLRPKKVPAKNKGFKRAHRIADRLPDEDQIYEQYNNPPESRPIDIDLPGLGQFYCSVCARHFKDQDTMEAHFKTPQHRRLYRRIKTEKPYSLEEANAAAGLGNYRYTPKGHKKDETEAKTEQQESANSVAASIIAAGSQPNTMQ